jgi:hypothetical protein
MKSASDLWLVLKGADDSSEVNGIAIGYDVDINNNIYGSHTGYVVHKGERFKIGYGWDSGNNDIDNVGLYMSHGSGNSVYLPSLITPVGVPDTRVVTTDINGMLIKSNKLFDSSTSGIYVTDKLSPDKPSLVNVIYGTDGTPPISASSVPEGTIYIQYDT